MLCLYVTSSVGAAWFGWDVVWRSAVGLGSTLEVGVEGGACVGIVVLFFQKKLFCLSHRKIEHGRILLCFMFSCVLCFCCFQNCSREKHERSKWQNITTHRFALFNILQGSLCLAFLATSTCLSFCTVVIFSNRYICKPFSQKQDKEVRNIFCEKKTWTEGVNFPSMAPPCATGFLPGSQNCPLAFVWNNRIRPGATTDDPSGCRRVRMIEYFCLKKITGLVAENWETTSLEVDVSFHTWTARFERVTHGGVASISHKNMHDVHKI